LSSKLKEITAEHIYTNQQKGYIGSLLLNALIMQLKSISSTSDKTAEADILAEQLEKSINTSNIHTMVAAYDFYNIKPNSPIVTNLEDMYSVADTADGISINWSMFYGENGSSVKLIKIPENTTAETKTLSANTPNKQNGSFTVTQNEAGVYAYKICLNKASSESCSNSFNVRVIKQSDQVTATDGAESETPAAYPLLASGDVELRPGKP
jgi:hypothetical protein